MSMVDDIRAAERRHKPGFLPPNRALPGRAVDHVPQARNHGQGLPPRSTNRIEPHVTLHKPATMLPTRLILTVQKTGPDIITFVFAGLPDPVHPADGCLSMKAECARGTGHHYIKKHFRGVPFTVSG